MQHHVLTKFNRIDFSALADCAPEKSPLHVAAFEGDFDTVVKNVSTKTDEHGLTALWYACLKGHEEIARFLVQRYRHQFNKFTFGRYEYPIPFIFGIGVAGTGESLRIAIELGAALPHIGSEPSAVMWFMMVQSAIKYGDYQKLDVLAKYDQDHYITYYGREHLTAALDTRDAKLIIALINHGVDVLTNVQLCIDNVMHDFDRPSDFANFIKNPTLAAQLLECEKSASMRIYGVEESSIPKVAFGGNGPDSRVVEYDASTVLKPTHTMPVRLPSVLHDRIAKLLAEIKSSSTGQGDCRYREFSISVGGLLTRDAWIFAQIIAMVLRYRSSMLVTETSESAVKCKEHLDVYPFAPVIHGIVPEDFKHSIYGSNVLSHAHNIYPYLLRESAKFTIVPLDIWFESDSTRTFVELPDTNYIAHGLVIVDQSWRIRREDLLKIVKPNADIIYLTK